MKKKEGNKKQAAGITFEKFLSGNLYLQNWTKNPKGFAMIETAKRIRRESYPIGQLLSGPEDHENLGAPTGWYFDSHMELCCTLSAKFLIFEHGDKFTPERWEAVHQVWGFGWKPVLVLFAPGTLAKFMEDKRFGKIQASTVLTDYAKKNGGRA